ncbi:hypothetical protein [Haloprofundus salilacus]|uniref:hypothetical protein n=1 Tax=Haloprofundus salilacus TaxID=2876190 RepID=UPI001CCE7F74|nr:hypothetical protein [Haloprofundus salilacus]
MSADRDAVDRMNEYCDLVDHTRQLRSNALEMDDLVNDMQWIAAGGRGAVDGEEMERLIRASRRICEDLEEVYADAPDPYEVQDDD